MATASATKTSEITEVESTALIQNLVNICISQIAWSRGLFPADCFEEKTFSGLAG
jgi:hypothetical protein